MVVAGGGMGEEGKRGMGGGGERFFLWEMRGWGNVVEGVVIEIK